MRTLIVFAKSPAEGGVKTRLARSVGRAAALGLYSAMVADLADRLRCGFEGRVLWRVDGDPSQLVEVTGPLAEIGSQSGTDLGERMANAFADAFEGSDGPVAIIGTDCPALTPVEIGKLFAEVENGADAAAIPSTDGGYTALALARRTDGAFTGVRWSSPETLADTRKALEIRGLRLAILPPLTDLDEFGDLAPIVKSGGYGPAFAEALAGFGWSAEPFDSVVDDLGRAVALNPPPKRIVSLVPSVTEALFDLGAGPLVVGRTDYCISPRPWVDRLPPVGGPKTFDPAGVLALAPDLVFADAEENDKSRVEALIDAGVRVFTALPRTLPDVSAFLRRAGLLTGCGAEAEKAASGLDGFLPAGNPANSLLLVWDDPVMVAGPGTLAGSLALAAGFRCAAPGGCVTGYPVVTDAELAGIDAKILLLPSEPHPFSPAEAVTLLKKSSATRVFLFPGEWVTWYGARTLSNLNNLGSLAGRAQGGGIFDFR